MYPLDRTALVYRLACTEHRAERLQTERDDAEKRAEQADARRRQAVSCALAVADLAEQWRARSYRDRVRADHNAELAYIQRQAALRAERVPSKTVTTLPWTGDDAA